MDEAFLCDPSCENAFIAAHLNGGWVLLPTACAYTFRDRRAVYAGKTERTGSKTTQTAVGHHGTCAGGAGTLSAGSFAGTGRAEHEKILLSVGYHGVAHLGCLRQAERPLYRQACVSFRHRPCLCGGHDSAGGAGGRSDCGGLQPKLWQPSVSCTRTAARPATHTCNTSMSTRER